MVFYSANDFVLSKCCYPHIESETNDFKIWFNHIMTQYLTKLSLQNVLHASRAVVTSKTNHWYSMFWSSVLITKIFPCSSSRAGLCSVPTYQTTLSVPRSDLTRRAPPDWHAIDLLWTDQRSVRIRVYSRVSGSLPEGYINTLQKVRLWGTVWVCCPLLKRFDTTCVSRIEKK